MSKIQKITLANFKAIKGTLEMDFKGCTAIITGGNDRGKSSFLRGIPDRIRFLRPDRIVNDNEDGGKGEILLTTGEKFIWEFDVKGKDKLIYVTTEGVKVGVTKEIGLKFFPTLFDIDKFLMSTPKEQAKQLQVIIGVDFTDIDNRYKIAYDDRTEKNRESEKFHVKLSQMIKAPKFDPVDLAVLNTKKESERTRLNTLYLSNKAENEKRRKAWEDTKEKVRKDCEIHNKEQADERVKYNACCDCASILKGHGFMNDSLEKFLTLLKTGIKEDKKSENFFAKEPEYITPELPDDKELKAIDAEILSASDTNVKAKAYTDYTKYVEETNAAKDKAETAQKLVLSIEAERKTLLESAKMPDGISITADGVTVGGFPLDRAQISTSKLYMAAVRIAAMNLGSVKTLHFDASFLDKNGLSEIEKWADENDLQLLIERPDFEGGEIEYHLIEKT